jgi:hypothetical protein
MLGNKSGILTLVVCLQIGSHTGCLSVANRLYIYTFTFGTQVGKAAVSTLKLQPLVFYLITP